MTQTTSQLMTKYYKFINVQEDGVMKNRDFEYKMGLNTVENFNNVPRCTSDALYFTDLKHIHYFIHYGNTLFEVSCPDDAEIVRVGEDKYKTNKLVVEREVVDESLLHDIYSKVIKREFSIHSVPEKYRTYGICLQAVRSNGTMLKYVPEKYKTYEICSLAVQFNGHALHYVPDEHKTQELCMRAVKTSGVKYVPSKQKIHEMRLQAACWPRYTFKV